jgi:homoserine dehydrogenase
MHRIAFIGFGTVGQGAVELLHERAEMLREQYGFGAAVVAVCTRRQGSLYHPDGLDQALLLKHANDFSQYPESPGLVRGLSPLAIIQETNANIIAEVSITDLTTGQPALSYCQAALHAGKHLIITNKGPVALAFNELVTTAKKHGCFFGYEGTVMGGTPTIRLAEEALAGAKISAFRGILNGTTNFMLSMMESGHTYSDALKEAQRLGYAEADPAGDVEGHDAAGKLVILANILFGVSLSLTDVDTLGITMLTEDHVLSAKAAGERYKLVAAAHRHADGTVSARVHPERLPMTDPLAGVNGILNAVTYHTDILGEVTLQGAGAGRRGTGFAVLSDLLGLHRLYGETYA